jgi:hypothetical protein
LSLLPAGLQTAFQKKAKCVQQEEQKSHFNNTITHNTELQQNILNGLRTTQKNLIMVLRETGFAIGQYGYKSTLPNNDTQILYYEMMRFALYP